MAEVSLGHFAAAAGKECRVDVQFKVESEALLRRILTHGAEDAHESLGGRELRGRRLVAKPVAARPVARVWQADASSHAFDGAQHLAGLSPRAIEQDNVRAERCIC
jgi:hypothetical protein